MATNTPTGDRSSALDVLGKQNHILDTTKKKKVEQIDLREVRKRYLK